MSSLVINFLDIMVFQKSFRIILVDIISFQYMSFLVITEAARRNDRNRFSPALDAGRRGEFTHWKPTLPHRQIAAVSSLFFNHRWMLQKALIWFDTI